MRLTLRLDYETKSWDLYVDNQLQLFDLDFVDPTLPALAVPCGFASNGLPLSLQIAGRPFDEATVLGLAHALEEAQGATPRPPLA